MSQTRDGVWKAGVWAPTVWGAGVWFELPEVAISQTRDGVWKAGVWAPTVWGAGVWFELPEVVSGGGGGKRRKYKRPRYYSEVDYVPQPEMAVRQFDPINESAMEDEETDDELILFLARVLH